MKQKIFYTKSLLPVFLYSGVLRLLLSYFLFRYVPLKDSLKALCLPILDFFDVSHMIRMWLYWDPKCLLYFHHFKIFRKCSIQTFFQGQEKETKENKNWNLWIDKIVDWFMYLLFYHWTFSRYSWSPLINKIIRWFLLWRFLGILCLFQFPTRHVLMWFPDFLNASFLYLFLYKEYKEHKEHKEHKEYSKKKENKEWGKLSSWFYMGWILLCIGKVCLEYTLWKWDMGVFSKLKVT